MAKYQTSWIRYQKIDEDTLVFKTLDQNPETLAYLDYYKDGTAEVTVHDPSTNSQRDYPRCEQDKARGIVMRHLKRLGYTEEEKP